MSLEKISAQLGGQAKEAAKKMPPVELWDPPFCGAIDLQIKSDGTWYYAGSAFKRLSLVKLFASVLKKETNEYFLVTPVEKVQITVEDAPFVITQWRWRDDAQKTMVLTTNVDDEFELNAEHQLEIAQDGGLYITVRRNLTAKVHRNVFYQWVDLAQQRPSENGIELVFFSAEQVFCLGRIEQ